MCVLCRTFGKELDALYHAAADLDGVSTYSPPVPARGNTVGQAATGQPQADGLISGIKWTGTVTYSFPDSKNDYAKGYGYGEPLYGFGSVSTTQMNVVHKVMAQVEALTGLNIDYAGTDGADIRIARSSEANPTAYAYYPGTGGKGEGGDVWFGNSYDYRSPVMGNYSYLTHVHELGHALGLKHAHESGGVAGRVPSAYDALEYTVMAYRSYVGGSISGGYTNEKWGYPQGLMMVDIAALQQMYGADFGHNSGNSVYTFNVSTGQMSINGVGQGAPGANRVFTTVWDGGGIDTYDFSNYTNAVTIDLRPGMYSITSNAQRAYLGDGQYAKGNLYNAFLYQGDARSYIENATGGSGNDKLIGNQVANVLDGRGGADVMIGGAGNDTYVVNHTGDVVDESTGSGIDTVHSSISFSLVTSAQVKGSVEKLVLTGSSTINGTGNSLANAITGNDAANRLNGGAGNDVINGRGGNDIINGQEHNDKLTGGAGNDVFVFDANMGHDIITDFDLNGNDVIQFSRTLFADFAAVLANAAAVSGGVLITADAANSLSLQSVTLASLTADDFRFV